MTGCAGVVNKNGKDMNNNHDRTDRLDGTTDTVVFKAEVMEPGDTFLVAPDPDSNEYKFSDKMAVHVIDDNMKNQKGRKISGDELKAGDFVEITYNGMVMESYPAQISADSVRVTGHNILIDGYLKIIDDIYQEDEGLNSGISMIAFDTSGWIQINKTEKKLLFDQMSKLYSVKIKEGTFEKLSKKGLIDKKNLYFKKGVLITISNMQYDEKEKQITYSIKKWRGGDGAVGADLVTASYSSGKWKISKKNVWIS